MTSDQAEVKKWMLAFGQECPEKPIVPSLEVRKLRAKLILEEALEVVRGLGFEVEINPLGELIPFEEEHFSGPDLLEIADGCEDLKVVTEGTLIACGLVDKRQFEVSENKTHIYHLNTDPLFNEVMRSNWSKFWKAEEFEETYKDQRCFFEKQFACYMKNPGKPLRVLVKNQDGKVIKSPSYSLPNLQPIIDELSTE